VARVAYVGLKAGVRPVEIDLDPGEVTEVWREFRRLIAAYADPRTGYTARRAMMKDTDASDYDHLSRFGEWDVTHDAQPEDLA
jgi:hypothetical protein